MARTRSASKGPKTKSRSSTRKKSPRSGKQSRATSKSRKQSRATSKSRKQSRATSKVHLSINPPREIAYDVKKTMPHRESLDSDDLASPMRRQVSVYKALAMQAALEAEKAGSATPRVSLTDEPGRKSSRHASALSRDSTIDPGVYARLCYQKADRPDIDRTFRRVSPVPTEEGKKKKNKSVTKKRSSKKSVTNKTKKRSSTKTSKKSPKPSPKKSKKKKTKKSPKKKARAGMTTVKKAKKLGKRQMWEAVPSHEQVSKSLVIDIQEPEKPSVPVEVPSTPRSPRSNSERSSAPEPPTPAQELEVLSDIDSEISDTPDCKSNLLEDRRSSEASEVEELQCSEHATSLSAIKAPLSRRHSAVSYEKEGTPEVFENFAETQFTAEKAKLKKTRAGRRFNPRKVRLSVCDDQTQLMEPEKEVVRVELVRQATVQQDKDVLASGKTAVSIKEKKKAVVKLSRGKSTTVLKEPVKPVEEPAVLAVEECSTELSEPEKEVIKLSSSKSKCVLEEPPRVIPEPVKLTVGKATDIAIKSEEVRLRRSKSTTVLKEPQKPVAEPVVLSLTEDATELAEPIKKPAEIVKLHRSKFTTVLKQPKKVVPEPVKLILSESATGLAEPKKPVVEPIVLKGSRSGIRMKAPSKPVVKLVEVKNDFTHKTEKVALSRACSGHAFAQKKVVEPKIRLVKDSKEVTHIVEEEKLVASKTAVALREPVRRKTKLALSNSSRGLAQDEVTLTLSNTSRAFAKDEVVVVENGLDIEEEYDWSYLKWYAGGVATQYLLSSGKRHSVRHHHHTKTQPARKN